MIEELRNIQMELNSKEKEIFSSYLEVVVPSMIEYENLTNAFPTGIMNEIRDVFFHFSKMVAIVDKNRQEQEFAKANRHMKRAMRDCYKYLCVAYENNYQNYRIYSKSFLRKIKKDSLINQISKIEQQHIVALEVLTKSRTMEKDIMSSERDEEIFTEYEKAVEAYKKLMEEIKTLYTIKI